MQARWGTHGEHSVIALVPSGVRECYTLTVEAFNLGGAVPHAGDHPLRRAGRPHARGRRAARAGQLRIAERGVPDCDPDEYDTVASALDNILPRPPLGSRFKCPRHRPRLQPPQRRPRHRRSRGRRATWAATCARRSITTATTSCASRRSRWRTPRWPCSPTAPSPARRGPSSSGPALRACGWAWSAPSRCGPSHQGGRAHGRAGAHRDRPRDEHPADGLGGPGGGAGRAKVVDYGRVDGKLITPDEIEELVKEEFYYQRLEAS